MGGISLINFAENCEVGGLPCGSGFLKHCNNQSVAMDDENFRSSTFNSGDDTLRGFRRRWITRPRSDASECLSDISGFQSEKSVEPDARRLAQEADLGSWIEVGSYNAPSIHDSELQDDDRELGHDSELGPEPSAAQSEVVQVAGDASTEFRWKCEALQSSAKRAKLYDNKFPWENSTFGGISLEKLTSLLELSFLGTTMHWLQLQSVLLKFCNRKLYPVEILTLHLRVISRQSQA